VNCDRVEELILEGVNSAELELHVAGCPRCLEFSRVQRTLDAQLQAAYPAPYPSPSFSRGLRRRIRAEQAGGFQDFVPEAAALAGGLVGTLLCIWAQPAHAAAFAMTGGVFTLVAGLAPSLVDWFE
jgi:hypothetical protein